MAAGPPERLASPPMPANPLTDPNWAEETTDQVVKLVDNVKAKTTRPAVLVARGLVFGILAAILGLFLFVLALILGIRSLQAGFSLFLDRPRAVYASYLFMGGALSIVGLLFFRKRKVAA